MHRQLSLPRHLELVREGASDVRQDGAFNPLYMRTRCQSVPISRYRGDGGGSMVETGCRQMTTCEGRLISDLIAR